MAIRSTTGTGVVVALVVFIIISAALLATTIYFYAKRAKNVEDTNAAKKQLNEVASQVERGSTAYTTVAGKRGRQTVFGYLNGEHQSLQDYVGLHDDIEPLKQTFNDDLGVDPNGSLFAHLKSTQRQLQENKESIETYKQRIKQMQDQVSALQGELLMTRSERDDVLVASVDGQLAGIREADGRYEQQVATALDGLEQTKDRNRNRYVGQIQDLEREVDRLSDENVRGESRIVELQSLVNRSRIQSKDPASLIDGEIIEVAGRGDQVYIDRGKADQIVLGMSFEVYDDPAQIRADEDGNFPRGKASIQVVKVGDTTSTAKVTRATKGRPVVSKDVIANAIYDPNYTFKFLVHGKFDIDGDGRATDEETDYLRRQIQSWGGTVLKEDRVTGDLDFLVLGVEPPNPQTPASNATETEIKQTLDARLIHQQYLDLFQAAKKADIPVLNANRLYILTGQTGL